MFSRFTTRLASSSLLASRAFSTSMQVNLACIALEIFTDDVVSVYPSIFPTFILPFFLLSPSFPFLSPSPFLPPLLLLTEFLQSCCNGRRRWHWSTSLTLAKAESPCVQTCPVWYHSYPGSGSWSESHWIPGPGLIPPWPRGAGLLSEGVWCCGDSGWRAQKTWCVEKSWLRNHWEIEHRFYLFVGESVDVIASYISSLFIISLATNYGVGSRIVVGIPKKSVGQK